MQHPLPANAFAALRNPGYDGPVASRIIEATRGHFSAVEMTYLRAVAEAPLWHEFDRLASASRVDLIGGQFVLPFKDDALLLRMPYRRFADTKSLAYAGVSRAAYFLATGQPLQAEAALRSIVSFGFVFIDNGTSAIEAMVGRVIVGIGIDGLHQLYTVTGNTEGVARTAATSRSTQPVQASSRARLDMDDRRGQLLDNVANPQLPRTLRYESLRALSFTTCGSVQEMLLGPSAEVRAAFDRAQRTLSRYPSERALIELMYEATNRPLPEMMSSRQSSRLIVGAAAVAGTVLNNPRIEACTRVALALGQ